VPGKEGNTISSRHDLQARRTLLDTETAGDEAIVVIRSPVGVVFMTENGELRGKFTHLIALGNREEAGYDKAALDERTACSIKVVAGT
jgi:hypothetical protein